MLLGPGTNFHGTGSWKIQLPSFRLEDIPVTLLLNFESPHDLCNVDEQGFLSNMDPFVSDDHVEMYPDTISGRLRKPNGL